MRPRERAACAAELLRMFGEGYEIEMSPEGSGRVTMLCPNGDEVIINQWRYVHLLKPGQDQPRRLTDRQFIGRGWEMDLAWWTMRLLEENGRL